MNKQGLIRLGALVILAAHSLAAQELWGIRNYRDLIQIDPATGNVLRSVPISGVPGTWAKFTLAYHKVEGAFYGFAYESSFNVRLIRYELPTGKATDLGVLPGDAYFEGLEYVDTRYSLVASTGPHFAGSPHIGTLSPTKTFTELLNNNLDNDALVYDSRRDILYSLDTDGPMPASQSGFVTTVNITQSPQTATLELDPAYHSGEDAFYSVYAGALYRWQISASGLVEVHRVGTISGQDASVRELPLAFVDLPAGLLAWWTANSTPLDNVGHHGGRLFGGTGFCPGKLGDAFCFDGTNDHLRADVQIRTNRAFTLSAWVSPETNMMSRGAVVCTRDGDIEYNPNSGFELNLWGDRDGNYTGARLRYLYMPTNRLPANRWSHLVLSASSDDTARFFINGVEVPLPPRLTDGGVLSRMDTTIGGNWPRNLDYFKGRIDEVHVYNRALTPTEAIADFVFKREFRIDVRASAIDVCWESRPDRRYRVQYRSNLTNGEWLDLAPDIPGNGQPHCISDPINSNETRFYRVIELR